VERLKFWRSETQLCLCKRIDDIWNTNWFCLIWILHFMEVVGFALLRDIFVHKVAPSSL
jgi:hypothetical protein